MDERPFVSVVIPVLDDYKRLGRCLQALAEQSYPTDRFEAIVVDNGTEPSQVIDVGEQYDFVCQIVEPRGGSYAARNAGLAQARGELLAFTDADCLPRPDWLEEGVKAVTEDKAIGLVAGVVDVFAADSESPTPAEIYELEFGFPQQAYVEDESFGATANIFSRRDVFDTVGEFDATLHSGGDHQWGQRVAQAGFDVVFAPSVVVAHPARRTLRELTQKIWRTRRAYHQRFWQGATGLQHATSLLRLARNALPPVRFIGRTMCSKRPLEEKAWLIGVRCYCLYTSKYVRLRLIVQELVSGGR